MLPCSGATRPGDPASCEGGRPGRGLGQVVLPCSGAVLDRSTILRHLATSATDPYTKTPLNPRMLAPAADLAARIAAWAQTRRAAAAAAAGTAAPQR